MIISVFCSHAKCYAEGLPASARSCWYQTLVIKMTIDDLSEDFMECACGCGGKPVKDNFLPGHDQRLRADLERRVGGLIELRMLVEAAEYFVADDLGGSQFSGMVKEVFQRKNNHH